MRIAVIDVKPEGKSSRIVLINPEMLSLEGELNDEEGCLSLPGVYAKLRRHSRARVRALDERGESPAQFMFIDKQGHFDNFALGPHAANEFGFVHVNHVKRRIERPCEFGRAPFVGLRVELLDQRHRAALVNPVHEALHPGVHDRLGLGDCGLAAGLGGLHHTGQVVHGVEVNVVQRHTMNALLLGVVHHRLARGEHAFRIGVPGRAAAVEGLHVGRVPGRAFAQAAADALYLLGQNDVPEIEKFLNQSKIRQAAQLVKLRFFAGLTSQQAAEALGLSARSADRLWAYARAFLLKRLKEPGA